MLSFFITVVSMMILFTITYWLLDTSIKYLFIILELLLITSIYILIQEINVTLRTYFILNIFYIMDIILMLMTLFLYIFIVTKTFLFGELILAVVISFFGLGYALLRIINFHPHHSNVEWLVLSFWLSIPINCIIYSIAIATKTEHDSLIISLEYIIFTLILLIDKYRRNYPERIKFYNLEISINIIFPITVVILFFIISIATN